MNLRRRIDNPRNELNEGKMVESQRSETSEHDAPKGMQRLADEYLLMEEEAVYIRSQDPSEIAGEEGEDLGEEASR